MSKNVKPGLDPNIRKKSLAYKQCFGTESGEKVLKDLKRVCQINVSSYSKADRFTPADPLEMAYRDGIKSVYWQIVKEINRKLDLPK